MGSVSDKELKEPRKPIRLLQRFDGQQGRLLLVEALQLQPIVGGDAVLAEAIAESSEVALYDSGVSIIEESAFDNALYFILAGVASIRVSGREGRGQDSGPAHR